MKYIILTALTAISWACARGYTISGVVILLLMLLGLWELTGRIDRKESLSQNRRETAEREERKRREFFNEIKMDRSAAFANECAERAS